MHMLRWICGHTRRDPVRNDDVRDRLEVALIEKFAQHHLRCVRVDWDISRYCRTSPNMVGYVRIYWDISRHSRISPDMVGYDNM
jgi:hypothetical protein